MHNINSMMYVGAKPWHGLGKQLEAVATSEEAIVAAGLNWRVRKERLQLKDGREVNAYATIREDTGDILGVVGDRYTILQNKSAFSFFDAIVGVKEAMYHTAGALGLGECVWILAKLPGIIRVLGDDITEKYLLLTNRHDGLGSVNVLFTPIRVVCQNTLNIAVSNAERIAKVRHTQSLGMSIERIRHELGIIHAQYVLFEQASQRLAVTQVTTEAWKKYLKDVGIAPKSQEEETTRAMNIVEEISMLFENGRGAKLPSARGTAWGAFNAIVEYVDYYRTSRGGEDNRHKSALFGSGQALKQKAWDTALLLAK